MNTAGNALAIATSGPVASYDIRYNRLEDGDYGHRILGTDILFFHDGILPDRHTLDLNQLKPGCVYENTVYLIPVRDKDDIGINSSVHTAVKAIPSLWRRVLP